jgi:thymidylate kinase
MTETQAALALTAHVNGSADPRDTGPKKSLLVIQLIDRMGAEGIRYCHWKSNIALREALAGEGDLDFLVDRKDANRFESLVAALGFKKAIDPIKPHLPSVTHYYGLDNDTGCLIHLHVYYRLITGETLLKNYSLPLEQLVLQNTRLVEGVPIPEAAAELIIFVVRAMLKYATLPEHYLIRNSAKALREELQSFLIDDAAAKADELLRRWLPNVDPALFKECIDCLLNGGSAWRRYRLGRRMRKQMRDLARFSATSEFFMRTAGFVREGLHRLFGGKKRKHQLASGGVVIAFLGKDASGKSTLVRAAADWLGQIFEVKHVHLGKPHSSWLTLLPNLVGKLLRRVMPGVRVSGRQKDRQEVTKTGGGLFYRFRMALLAWDRRAMALPLHRSAGNGWIAISDRYPSTQVGAIDSLSVELPTRGWLKNLLAKIEARLYRRIPPPHIVIRVFVPVEVAVERNRKRFEPGKDKSDAYLLFNHQNVILPTFHQARTVEINTNRSMEETIRDLRRVLWELL